MQGEKNSRKANKEIDVEKNSNRFKKLKLKKKREENFTELQKPNVETEVYDNNKKM